MAFLRTSTGTPAEDKYEDFEVAYRAIDRNKGILSPNEYESNFQPESAGNLERYTRHWEQFDRLGLPRPATVIGEYAILRRIYEGNKGYPTFGLGGVEYAARVLATDETWYDGVWVCLYSFGEWGDGLGVQDDEGFLGAVEDYYIDHPNPPIGSVPPPVIVDPPDETPTEPDDDWRDELKVTANNLRSVADALDALAEK